MITLLRLELEKLFRSKGFYLSFAVLVGFVILMLWGFYTYAARKTGGRMPCRSTDRWGRGSRRWRALSAPERGAAQQEFARKRAEFSPAGVSCGCR